MYIVIYLRNYNAFYFKQKLGNEIPTSGLAFC